MKQFTIYYLTAANQTMHEYIQAKNEKEAKKIFKETNSNEIITIEESS